MGATAKPIAVHEQNQKSQTVRSSAHSQLYLGSSNYLTRRHENFPKNMPVTLYPNVPET